MWEAGDEGEEACGGPPTSIVPSLRLSSSGKKEVAATKVPAVQGRERLLGNVSMLLLSRSAQVSWVSAQASFCVQPEEEEGVAIQPCGVRHCPSLGPNLLYCVSGIFFFFLQTLDHAPFPPLSHRIWSFLEDSRKFLGK